MPVRHDLDEWIAAYVDGAGLAEAPKGSALFRAGERRGSPLTDRAMSPLAVQLMLMGRLKAARLPEILSPHSFRVLVVTDLLSQNVPARGCPVPARARPPPHHPDLRPPPAACLPQPGRADFRLRDWDNVVNERGDWTHCGHTTM